VVGGARRTSHRPELQGLGGRTGTSFTTMGQDIIHRNVRSLQDRGRGAIFSSLILYIRRCIFHFFVLHAVLIAS
jgi:hypothetical protein